MVVFYWRKVVRGSDVWLVVALVSPYQDVLFWIFWHRSEGSQESESYSGTRGALVQTNKDLTEQISH
jgi:hypothetical protein